ncbi:MAG: GNAT family N-acetyltransferase [Alphaproteobacteria bacterium]|jgi:GNAT superfamily N-acetyltransferase|nr:GNAT family N-acetyltransferase [Alphaproteobacteria bacterium]
MTEVTIAPPTPDDRAAWRRLFDGYRRFYGVETTDAGAETTWGWIHDPGHVVEALVARTGDGALVGLAHFRAMPSPLRGIEVGFLDDLFVDPDYRGGRVGERLIAAVVAVGQARGWPKIRWLTADDNYRARTLYDRVGRKTTWNLYEVEVG